MTDPPSSSLHSHTAPSAQGTADFPTSPVNHASASKAPPAPEENDYTIKCICGFKNEDQGSIYCENCDTWQHTECYYIKADGSVPTNVASDDFEHLCVDCQPRPVDRKGALERQRARLEQLELNERRLKKPPSKSHKKKPKNSELNGVLTNGSAHNADPDSAHDRTSRSPRDNLPPSKRSKAGHRPSHSTNLPSFSQHANLNTHKRSASAIQSPTKVPLKTANGHDKDSCSVAFVHLYDNDPGDTELQTNLLNDIQITTNLKAWSWDIEALREAAPKWSHTEIFQRTEKPISSMQMPDLQKEEREDQDTLVDGQHPKWKWLTVDSSLPKDTPVGEIKGKIGHVKEYTDNPANRWDYLRHPEPFVFFHKHLPIYIDTRSEGTTCRYLRRSCDPNLVMKTFLENDSEYHFCFVASRDIEPEAELTIGWTLDENMRRILEDQHNGVKEEVGAGQEEYMADWASKVLLEFGGCACNTSRCSMALYANRAHGSSKASKRYLASAPNTGYRINSRDDSEQDDSRSTSESKSGSRDMTPTDGQAGDFGMEISAREKRKIAAMEKNFEQLEEKPALKKKKRNSGGSSINTPSAGTSKQLGHNNTFTSYSQPNTPGLSHKPQYADAGTSRRKSGSPTSLQAKSSNATPGPGRPRSSTTSKTKPRPSMPNTPKVPSPLFRSNYVSQGMQTDPTEDEDDWSKSSQSPAPAKRPYMSLTKRLLLRSQQERQMLEQRRSASLESSRQQSADHMDVNTGPMGFGSPHVQEDTEMQDAGSASSPKVPPTPSSGLANLRLQEQTSAGEDIKPPPPPWPQDSSIQADYPAQTNGFRTPDLHVDLPPKTSEAGGPGTPLVENANFRSDTTTTRPYSTYCSPTSTLFALSQYRPAQSHHQEAKPERILQQAEGFL